MGDKTQIEWTDATWNPVTGCTRVSEGCRNCYIERTVPFRTQRRRFLLNGEPSGKVGASTGVECHPDRLDQPLRWARPRRVFTNSLSDLFHTDIPREFIAEVFAVMVTAEQHTFQVLTKRPGRMRALLTDPSFLDLVDEHRLRRRPLSFGLCDMPRPNIWLGVSVEDQHAADTRIPELLRTPAAIRFLSCEPLIGPVDLSAWVHEPPGAWVDDHFVSGRGDIDWAIVGGESGPGARPMHPDWARNLRDRCVAAGVGFHFKQWGEWNNGSVQMPRAEHRAVLDDGRSFPAIKTDLERELRAAGVGADEFQRHRPCLMAKIGKKASGRELDGRTWDEWPAEAARA